MRYYYILSYCMVHKSKIVDKAVELYKHTTFIATPNARLTLEESVPLMLTNPRADSAIDFVPVSCIQVSLREYNYQRIIAGLQEVEQ